jgi:hypothetical protein
MLLPELERCRHIGGIDAAGDRRGPAVDQQVEAESCPLVFPIGRAEHVTRQRSPQLIQSRSHLGSLCILAG